MLNNIRKIIEIELKQIIKVFIFSFNTLFILLLLPSCEVSTIVDNNPPVAKATPTPLPACTLAAQTTGTACYAPVDSWISGTEYNGRDANCTSNNGGACYITQANKSLLDANLVIGNIKNGTTIFGVTGNYTGTTSLPPSNALRDSGVASIVPNLLPQTTSNQLTLDNEINSYGYGNAGNPTDLPTTGGYNYRDIPDDTKDDDGYLGTTSQYAPRPGSDCGLAGTIAARISNCATTWNGATAGSRGHTTWKLVTRKNANKEVWRDEATGLLWSSLMSTGSNWCKAAGVTTNAPVSFFKACNSAAANCSAAASMTGNGTISAIFGGSSSVAETVLVTFTSETVFTVSGACGTGGILSGGPLTTSAGSSITYSRAGYCSFLITQGSTNFAVNDRIEIKSTAAATYSCAPGAASGLQLASPVSYCAEGPGLAPADGGENWGTPIYADAKGGMGKNSSTIVYWRLPTIEDYNIANAHGIRSVMPDMGIAGTDRPLRDGSSGSLSPHYEWSASMLSSNRYIPLTFYGSDGDVLNRNRDNNNRVRCVGR